MGQVGRERQPADALQRVLQASLPATGALRRWDEELKNHILESSHDAIQLLSLRGELLALSPAGRRLLGTNQTQLPGDWRACWAEEQRPAVEEALQLAARGGKGHFVGSYLGHADRWWNVLVTPVLGRDARPDYLLAVAREVTAEKAAEQALANALAQRDLMFREMSHRVVNGFQLVASMLHLQKGRAADPMTQALLDSAERRVNAMALVHRRLYQASGTENVQMLDYLSGLCTDLHQTLIEGSSRQRLLLEADPALTIAYNRVVPIGLLLTELVTNAAKHALQPSREGRILVGLRAQVEEAVLTVEDDGPGLPEDFDPRRPRGLGMVIVRTQVEQLAGTLTIEAPSPGAPFPGTRFVVTFPLVRSAAP